MTKDKKFQYCEEENGEFPFPYIKTDNGETIITLYACCKHLNILCDKNEQLKKENEELKEEVELLRFGLKEYESLLPSYLDCAEISSFRSDLFEFEIKQLKFYKEHPNLCKLVIDGVEYE